MPLKKYLDSDEMMKEAFEAYFNHYSKIASDPSFIMIPSGP